MRRWKLVKRCGHEARNTGRVSKRRKRQENTAPREETQHCRHLDFETDSARLSSRSEGSEFVLF